MIPRIKPGPEFSRARHGRKSVYLHRSLVESAPEVLVAVEELMHSTEAGAGNRGSGFQLSVDGAPDLFLRKAKHGGMVQFLGDIYFGPFPRVVTELALTAEVRKRGVNAPEPMGAVVEHLAPAVHRGALITKAIPGMTLWQFVEADDDRISREHVLRAARGCIDRMHEAGVFHGDLNLHNLFVSTALERLDVVILDFDKARIFNRPLSSGARWRNLRRLARSIRKLDSERTIFSEKEAAILTA
jgi:tRNA A-37 threonylcarbamoyl transferase component Bud32